MKQGLIYLLFLMGVVGLSGALAQKQQPHQGTITPKLALVAKVDGKAFFIDRPGSFRSYTEAVEYCNSLGMQLGEITSARQFLAIDQAVVEEWTENYDAWIAGIESTGIQRYVWNRSNVSVDPSYGPYEPNYTEEPTTYLTFVKRVNGSVFSNRLSSVVLSVTLCEN